MEMQGLVYPVMLVATLAVAQLLTSACPALLQMCSQRLTLAIVLQASSMIRQSLAALHAPHHA